jgi:hypothetical protein
LSSSHDNYGVPGHMVVRNPAGEPVALVELTYTDSGLADQLGGLRGGMADALGNMEKVGEGIAETCRQVMQSVRANTDALAPDEFELTFGVKISGEGGIPLVTKASGEATLEVKARWGAPQGA